MRCLERNKQSFWYANYEGEQRPTDGDGFETGERRVVYSSPVQFRANVSPATGNSSVEQFGNSLQYDKVIVTDDLNCPIDEHSVLCIDGAPVTDSNGKLIEFDYIVKKIARSLNSVSIAVSKVEVS